MPFPEILIIELRCGCLFVRYGKIVSNAKVARKEKKVREQIARTLEEELRK
jgi:hypothetical protein